jgi:hypothetical protein
MDSRADSIICPARSSKRVRDNSRDQMVVTAVTSRSETQSPTSNRPLDFVLLEELHIPSPKVTLLYRSRNLCAVARLVKSLTEVKTEVDQYENDTQQRRLTPKH